MSSAENAGLAALLGDSTYAFRNGGANSQWVWALMSCSPPTTHRPGVLRRAPGGPLQRYGASHQQLPGHSALEPGLRVYGQAGLAGPMCFFLFRKAGCEGLKLGVRFVFGWGWGNGRILDLA